VEFVQFVDGDCQIVAGWLAAALRAMETDPRLAVACGRRRECHPDQSIYNRLCDIEWNTPVGVARSCGGDALMRVRAVAEVDGYDERVIAGEEPEMCVRLRRHGWTIRRLDQEMTLHDAAMTQLSQWWRRHQRAGHAYAQGAALHGRSRERHGVRQSLSVWFWALVWPFTTALLVGLCGVTGLLALLAYPLMVTRIAIGRRRQFHDPWPHCLLYALACVMCKWPQLAGQVRFLRDSLRGRPAELIEYKQR
jgi:GT2 family glycosyltransferase